jgi:type I restriction enzyme S subunit
MKIRQAHLPTGWEVKKLGELVNIKTGKLDSNAMVKNGEYPFFTCSREVFRINQFAFDCEAILLAGNNASGDFNVKYYNGKFNAYQRTYVISTKNKHELLYGFLYHQLINHLKKFKEQSVGANTKFLKIGMIQDMIIPLPPIQEQQYIISIIDKTFAAIELAKANVERNLQNAKELFQSELNTIFSRKGEGVTEPAEVWVEKKLKDVGETQTGNTPSTKDADNFGNYIPFVKPGHFKPDGTIDAKDSGLSEKGLKLARLFRENTILMVCIGATIGKTGYVNVPVTSNQQINALTPKVEYHARFFYYALIAPLFQKRILSEGKGAQATLPIINKSKWENLTVCFPKDKEIQLQIVERLDALSSETKKLEAKYQAKLAALEELKKSVLEKAFRGEI